MNTNRDSSQRTQYNKAKMIAAYNKSITDSITAGNVGLFPASSSDRSANIHTELVAGRIDCCVSNGSTSNASPTYTTYYAIFTTTGSSTWTAPATIQSPITYWIVGGGGGGAGAFDQRGNGGGG